MKQTAFALFVDVLGVQQQLVPSEKQHSKIGGFDRCRNRLEDFHQDLSNIIHRDLPLLLVRSPIRQPRFIAEFSDSAYIVGDQFASVAIPALFLMRRALRHKYPLRGGIGIGSFSHESSGVQTSREGQIWSTSSFLGGAIVTAYQAERSNAPGLRVFIHPLVMQRAQEINLNLYALPLPADETSAASSHELRFWHSTEAAAAIDKLRAFREGETLPEQAGRHYDSAVAAYERFGSIKKQLPHALMPQLWLFRD